MKRLSKYVLNAALLATLASKPATTAEQNTPMDAIRLELSKYNDINKFYDISATDTIYPQKEASEIQENLLEEYLAYEHKLDFHIETIEKYAKEYAAYDSSHSDTSTLLAYGLAQAYIESRIQQTTTNNYILRSPANAKGTFQFLEVALVEANKILKRKQAQDSSYFAVDSFDVARALQPTPQGAAENIRAGMFMLKHGLEHFHGDWQWHAARYNWGTGNLQNAGITQRNLRQNKEKLPLETRNYITLLDKLTTTKGADPQAYKEQLLTYQLQKLYRRELRIAASPKYSLERREEALEDLVAFNEGLKSIDKPLNEDIKPYLAKMHYYKGEVLRAQDKFEEAQEQYQLAQNMASEDTLIYRNASYRLRNTNPTT